MDWFRRQLSAEEKENDPLGLEETRPITRPRSNSRWQVNGEEWVEAESFIRFQRWTAGYEILVKRNNRDNWGHIVKSDNHRITVDWFCRHTKKVKRETFRRGNEFIEPLPEHIINIIENGLSGSVNYEYDEEKVDNEGNFLNKVMFRQTPR